MGFSTAASYAQAAAAGEVSLNDAIVMHLAGNCFPPIPADFHPGVIKAVDYANAEDWDEQITFPNGRTFSVAQVIEKLHLGVFVYRADEEPLEVDSL